MIPRKEMKSSESDRAWSRGLVSPSTSSSQPTSTSTSDGSHHLISDTDLSSSCVVFTVKCHSLCLTSQIRNKAWNPTSNSSNFIVVLCTSKHQWIQLQSFLYQSFMDFFSKVKPPSTDYWLLRLKCISLLPPLSIHKISWLVFWQGWLHCVADPDPGLLSSIVSHRRSPRRPGTRPRPSCWCRDLQPRPADRLLWSWSEISDLGTDSAGRSTEIDKGGITQQDPAMNSVITTSTTTTI